MATTIIQHDLAYEVFKFIRANSSKKRKRLPLRKIILVPNGETEPIAPCKVKELIKTFDGEYFRPFRHSFKTRQEIKQAQKELERNAKRQKPEEVASEVKNGEGDEDDDEDEDEVEEEEEEEEEEEDENDDASDVHSDYETDRDSESDAESEEKWQIIPPHYKTMFIPKSNASVKLVSDYLSSEPETFPSKEEIEAFQKAVGFVQIQMFNSTDYPKRSYYGDTSERPVDADEWIVAEVDALDPLIELYNPLDCFN